MNNISIPKKSSGFSMLEVLISLLILAVGLLGLLNLQITSLKNNHSAQLRTTATVLAYDMLDRIRLNKTEDYTLSMSNTHSGATTKDTDITEWLNDLSTVLPSGQGAISYSGSIVTIKVQWDDSRAGGSSSQIFEVSSLP